MPLNRSFLAVLKDKSDPKNYSPGDTISGMVFCRLQKPLKIRELRVVLEGEEHTNWQYKYNVVDANTGLVTTNIEEVKGYNRFLHKATTLAGKGTLPAGEHIYSFTFQLPEKLPSSFNGYHGNVKYFITGIAEIPFGFDLRDEMGLRVESIIDLNKIPWLNPGHVHYVVRKTPKRFFSSLGNISMQVFLEKTALVPGEGVDINIDLENSSSVDILRVEAKITRFTVSYPNNRTRKLKRDNRILSHVSYAGIGPLDKRTYSSHMVIPPGTWVVNLFGCELFKQWTQLDVKVIVSGLFNDLNLTIPIKLGHIAFKDCRKGIQRALSASSFDFLGQSSAEDPEEVLLDNTEVPSTSFT